MNTNYCAEYLTVANSPDARIEVLHNTIGTEATADWVKRAVKFRLPDNGQILEVLPISKLSAANVKSTYSKYIDIVKLPYDSVALEFLQRDIVDGTPVTAKMVVLANNMPDDQIVFTAIFGDRAGNIGEWCDSSFVGILESDFSVFGKTNNKGNINPASGEMSQEMSAVLLHTLNVLLGFLAALACSNSGTADIPASNLVNKKRIKKGKQPFFDYKVLTIDTKANSQKQKGCLSNGSTKRVHLRRGHIRRLEHKTVWVNPCVVGDKSKGMVTKDYKVI